MTAASCESSRRRRAIPAIRYSGSDSTSRATNISSRLFEIGKISIPATANIRSGNTSVCTCSVRERRRSSGEPTTKADAATIGLPTSTLRSAISSVAITARIRIVPWMNSPVGSIASEPANATSDPDGDGVVTVLPCRRATVTSEPTNPRRHTPTWTENRSRRGTTASTITPSSAPASTMKIGNSAR